MTALEKIAESYELIIMTEEQAKNTYENKMLKALESIAFTQKKQLQIMQAQQLQRTLQFNQIHDALTIFMNNLQQNEQI